MFKNLTILSFATFATLNVLETGIGCAKTFFAIRFNRSSQENAVNISIPISNTQVFQHLELKEKSSIQVQLLTSPLPVSATIINWQIINDSLDSYLRIFTGIQLRSRNKNKIEKSLDKDFYKNTNDSFNGRMKLQF